MFCVGNTMRTKKTMTFIQCLTYLASKFKCIADEVKSMKDDTIASNIINIPEKRVHTKKYRMIKEKMIVKKGV